MQGWIQPGWASIKSQARPLDRVTMATWSAIVVHVAGSVGILFIDKGIFVSMTPLNLLIMQVLAWGTRGTGATTYAKAFAWCAITGMVAEWVGVHTGLLFGDYTYGNLMGPKFDGVPWLIGGNWFLVLSGSLALVIQVRDRILARFAEKGIPQRSFALRVATPVMAALVATAFDGIMEPAAVKLGFWTWTHGNVPVFNYICWFGLSLLLLVWGGDRLRLAATTFASRLLLIQAVFFLLVAVSR